MSYNTMIGKKIKNFHPRVRLERFSALSGDASRADVEVYLRADERPGPVVLVVRREGALNIAGHWRKGRRGDIFIVPGGHKIRLTHSSDAWLVASMALLFCFALVIYRCL